MLPERFAYLRPVAEKYFADARTVESLDLYVKKLSQEKIAELQVAFAEMERRYHLSDLYKWMQWQEQTDNLEWRLAHNLLWLFKLLGEQGHHPFKKYKDWFYTAPEPPIDWNDLPSSVRYIIGPAEKYGVIQFGEDIDRFITDASPDEMEELRALAPLVKADFEIFDDWLREKDITGLEGRSAARVYFMFTLMTELGLM